MLVRNLALNLAGQLAPLIAAVFSIPLLIKGMGTDRFGLLTIAWMVIGYFSVFDLGLGRALTRAVAEKIGNYAHAAIPQLVWTGLVLMTGLSLLAAATIALLTPWLASNALKIPQALVGEATIAFYLLAVSVPAVILTTGLRGVMEAYGRFDLTNLIRVPMGVWTFLGPLLVLPFSQRLDYVVMMLVGGRMVTTLLHLPLLRRTSPRVLQDRVFDRTHAKALFASGGWMTVSNVISPIMVYMDRFLISAILGVAVVAYYTTPYEVVFKLNFFPEAVFGVLFPIMAMRFAGTPQSRHQIFELGNLLIALVMVPMTLLLVLLAPEIMTWWLGKEFALKSTYVMQILAIGLCINSFSKVAFNYLQANGNSRTTALIHFIELPIYLMVLWILSQRFGIEGAAVAWAARMLLDLLFLLRAAVVQCDLPGSSALVSIRLLITSGLLYLLAFFISGLIEKALFFAVFFLAFQSLLWLRFMKMEQRTQCLSLLSSLPVVGLYAAKFIK